MCTTCATGREPFPVTGRSNTYSRKECTTGPTHPICLLDPVRNLASDVEANHGPSERQYGLRKTHSRVKTI
ncbi:hypothetical protein J437_LFUL013014 [Ladona fulva]|uniref:Uncharacterized protein n=1 Tax=Ladona fulva TaxID=123851 RepID=A0A8K0PBC7_LADFU|nr:hypothetical protein J437_LFUL013014 [Ladona fulva]